MNTFLKLFCILIISLLSLLPAYAQQSTVGREFYFGFMDNYRRDNQPDKAIILITANEDAGGQIRTLQETVSFNLKAGEQFIREFDGTSGNIIHRNAGVIENRGVHILSDGDIAVHAINGREFSTDGTVVLPVSSLGKEYLITAHYDKFSPGLDPGNNENFESTLLIVAVEDETRVEVTLTAGTTGSVPKGSTIELGLDKGQSYQIKGVGDLTGTRVKVINDTPDDCKRVAVFSGNKLTSVGPCGTTGEHLFQQAYPLDTWGKSYVHVPLKGRVSGDFVKVLASQDNTTVNVDGDNLGTLNAGEFLQLDMPYDQVSLIETSKPSAVSVLAKSVQCNGPAGGNLGDPLLITYSSTTQFTQSVYFSTGQLVSNENQELVHTLNLVVSTGSQNFTTLNGQAIGGEFTPLPGSGFSYARINVPEGVNQVSNPDGFFGYLYANGTIESYGYAIGGGMNAVQFEADSEYDFEVIGERVACFGQEGTWEIIPDNPAFTDFTWDFGDQSSLVIGQEVKHTFETEGEFEVKVIASTGGAECDSQEEFTFEVQVNKVDAMLEGPSAVCPNQQGVIYSITDTLNYSSTIWEIDGGNIVTETDFQLTVDWGNSNPSALIRAIPVAPNGCQGRALEISVEVASDYTAAIPEGPEGICANQTSGVYTIPLPLAGMDYQWYVTGGKLLSGQGTAQVEIEWDISAARWAVYYEEQDEAYPTCKGVSGLLEIQQDLEIDIEIVDQVNPSCPLASDGLILLEAKGGTGDFEFSWSHDPTLQEAHATDLPAGTYEITVSDAFGCGEKTVEVVLTDPGPVIASLLEVSNPDCNGEFSGEVLIEVAGGEAPFEVIGRASQWDSGLLTVSGLSAGTYELMLVDANGCSATVNATLIQIEPLAVSFISNSPNCGDEMSGSLQAAVSGGVPPYRFEWENGSTSETLQNVLPGEYSVSISDANNCLISLSGKITEAVPAVRMPTGFDPRAGNYEPVTSCSISFQLNIYDRWGALIYSGTEGWDGVLNNEVNAGVYTYLVQYEYQIDQETYSAEQRGSFTLIQ
ncbi:PKD domain-containing protein [Algoriphagus halophytocola]|uniref:PKD domain-containing protein n=1 Tax=Algoriphagus halophytocola TaxID=2991499 RepID=A0ABY6MJC2_9BACT|nr:PKD domain-containing protein [Algoriphagus sp. TR-M5]UZD23263.1 PKD domain-containing protein [Algoriphagus sp. TR-M5]